MLIGKKINLILQDVDQIDLLGKYFPVTKDLSRLFATILIQFKGEINVNLDTFKSNLFRVSLRTMVDDLIEKYRKEDKLTYQEAYNKALEVCAENNYKAVYELKDAMYNTFQN